MNDKWKHIVEQGECPDVEKLIQYQQNKLDREESFFIENHLAGCEICNDVLEGFSKVKSLSSLESATKDLKQQVYRYISKDKKKGIIIFTWQRLSIAASLLILAGIAIMFFLIRKPNNISVTQNENELKSAPRFESVNNPEKISKKFAKAERMKIPEFKKSLLSKEKEFNNENIPQKKAEASELTPAASMADETKKEMMVVEEAEKSQSFTEERKEEAAKDRSFPSGHGANYTGEKRFIKGKVLDQSGQILPGVNVVVNGSSKGTVTDVNGNFKIEVDKNKDALTFSYIGYVQQDVNMTGKDTSLTIKMTEEVRALNEVVVVGYGVQKKSDLTGAVLTISPPQLSSTDTNRAEVFIKTGNVEGAIEEYNKRLMVNNNDKDALTGLARCYLMLNDTTNAMVAIRTLITLSGNSKQTVQLNNICKLINEGNNNKALKILNKLK